VRMDPRVHTPAAALLEQFGVSMRIYEEMLRGAKVQAEVRAARERLSGDLAEEVAALAGGQVGRRRGAGADRETLASVMAQLTTLLREVQSADAAPTAQARAAAGDRGAALRKLVDRWEELRARIR
jgi:hypothetical protein